MAFLTFDLDLQTRETKHVFRVNLAQIRSAVPEIYHTQTNNRTFCSSLHVVITGKQSHITAITARNIYTGTPNTGRSVKHQIHSLCTDLEKS